MYIKILWIFNRWVVWIFSVVKKIKDKCDVLRYLKMGLEKILFLVKVYFE